MTLLRSRHYHRERMKLRECMGGNGRSQSLASNAKNVAVLCLVSLLAGALLLSQFAATYHELTVRHAVCPQHGELVDLDERQSNNALTSNVGLQERQLAPANEPLQGHHQHCLFVSSRTTRHLLRVAKPLAAGTPRVAQPAVASRAEIRNASVAIYLAAPKHSPPTA